MFNPWLRAAQPQDPRNHAGARAGCCQDSKEHQNRCQGDASNSLIHLALASSNDAWMNPFLLFHNSDYLTNQVSSFAKFSFRYEQSAV